MNGKNKKRSINGGSGGGKKSVKQLKPDRKETQRRRDGGGTKVEPRGHDASKRGNNKNLHKAMQSRSPMRSGTSSGLDLHSPYATSSTLMMWPPTESLLNFASASSGSAITYGQPCRPSGPLCEHGSSQGTTAGAIVRSRNSVSFEMRQYRDNTYTPQYNFRTFTLYWGLSQVSKQRG